MDDLVKTTNKQTKPTLREVRAIVFPEIKPYVVISCIWSLDLILPLSIEPGMQRLYLFSLMIVVQWITLRFLQKIVSLSMLTRCFKNINIWGREKNGNWEVVLRKTSDKCVFQKEKSRTKYLMDTQGILVTITQTDVIEPGQLLPSHSAI